MSLGYLSSCEKRANGNSWETLGFGFTRERQSRLSYGFLVSVTGGCISGRVWFKCL